VILRCMMSEESTTSDLDGIMGRAFEAANRRDLDAVASSFTEDASFDGRALGDHFHLRQCEGWIFVWLGGLIARLTISDIDEARASAQRLAQERG
jgi:hypothetical protein